MVTKLYLISSRRIGPDNMCGIARAAGINIFVCELICKRPGVFLNGMLKDLFRGLCCGKCNLNEVMMIKKPAGQCHLSGSCNTVYVLFGFHEVL